MAPEDGPVIPPHLCRHLERDPVYPQDTERPETHSIPRQDVKTSFPVQGIIGLAQVKEVFMDYCLSNGDELLKQIFLKGGYPRYSPRAKSIQIVVELDGRQ